MCNHCPNTLNSHAVETRHCRISFTIARTTISEQHDPIGSSIRAWITPPRFIFQVRPPTNLIWEPTSAKQRCGSTHPGRVTKRASKRYIVVTALVWWEKDQVGSTKIMSSVLKQEQQFAAPLVTFSTILVHFFTWKYPAFLSLQVISPLWLKSALWCSCVAVNQWTDWLSY